MRIVITGGAGFLGSQLTQRLLERGDQVTCIDNLSTGSMTNLAEFTDNPAFEFLYGDVCAGDDAIEIAGNVDAVAHLASPASPPDYQRLPLETLAAGSRGTEFGLRLALRHRARFVLASTSEVYGDPLEHPQREDYWGNVNPIGPRSVYDEAKRYAEALTEAYRRTMGAKTGIVRIFNTYGPKMRANDGRVVSSFIVQALNGDPLTIYGDGSHTRSFCYVDDLIRGLVSMIGSSAAGPINLGNYAECSVVELAALIRELTGSQSEVRFYPLPIDDPQRRRPHLGLARAQLHWEPRIGIREGLSRTAAWFSGRGLERAAASVQLAGPQLAGVAPTTFPGYRQARPRPGLPGHAMPLERGSPLDEKVR